MNTVRRRVAEMLAGERAALQRDQAQAELLRDRTVGGHAPRPSPDMIERQAPPLRSPEEIEALARQKTAARLRSERRTRDEQRANAEETRKNIQANERAKQKGAASPAPEEAKRSAGDWLKAKLLNDRKRGGRSR